MPLAISGARCRAYHLLDAPIKRQEIDQEFINSSWVTGLFPKSFFKPSGAVSDNDQSPLFATGRDRKVLFDCARLCHVRRGTFENDSLRLVRE